MADHPTTHEDRNALTRALWCLLFMYYLLAIYFGVNVALALKGDSMVSIWVSAPLMLMCVACAYICARIVDHRNLQSSVDSAALGKRDPQGRSGVEAHRERG